MKDLAWISLARVYYTAANRINAEGIRQVDGVLLGNAVEAWNKIDSDSEYWLDALCEESWAFFLADEYSRALGNVHTLFSPYFKESFYPEAMVLKAVVFFTNCQMKNATAMVQLFHEKYDPVKSTLDELLTGYQDNAQFFDSCESASARQICREPVASWPCVSDRALGNFEYVALLDKRADPQQFQGSSRAVARRAHLQDVLVAKSFAIDQAGEIAKATTVGRRDAGSPTRSTPSRSRLNYSAGSCQELQAETAASESTRGRVRPARAQCLAVQRRVLARRARLLPTEVTHVRKATAWDAFSR
jgi:hypothetical protein